MSAFTPGPWFASREMEDDYGFPYCTVGPFDTSGMLSEDHVEDTIAEVSGINHHANANARLIAAAPDLLATLKQILMECLDEGHSDSGDPTDQCRHRGMAIRCGICMSLDDVKASIAKAEGA